MLEKDRQIFLGTSRRVTVIGSSLAKRAGAGKRANPVTGSLMHPEVNLC